MEKHLIFVLRIFYLLENHRNNMMALLSQGIAVLYMLWDNSYLRHVPTLGYVN